MRLLRSRVGVLVLIFALGGPPGAIATKAGSFAAVSVSFSFRDGVDLLSVTAEAVPLGALLSEVARRAGFEFTETKPIERPVSVELKRVPLDRALRQLLARENFILIYGQPSEGGPTKLERVILLRSDPSQQGDSSVEPVVSLSDGVDGVPASGEPPHVVPEDAPAFNPDGPLDDLLLLTTHRDPRMSRAALEALTLHAGDERARRKLIEHLSDPDPKIRSVALGLLGPFVTEWPGAEEVVMTALRDPAAWVRHLALHTLEEASSPRLADALPLALLDEDPGVRALAEELLHRAPVEESSE